MLQHLKTFVKSSPGKDKQIMLGSPINRGLSFVVDSLVLAFFRVMFMLLVLYFLEVQRQIFINSFYAKFGATETMKITNSQHMHFFINSAFAKLLISLLAFMVLIGMVYHIVFLLSSWKASPGQRLARLYVVNKKGTDLTALDIFARVILSYVPWFLPIGIYFSWTNYPVLGLTLLLLLCFWNDTYVFTGERLAIHDVLMGCIIVSGKRGESLHWYKKTV